VEAGAEAPASIAYGSPIDGPFAGGLTGRAGRKCRQTRPRGDVEWPEHPADVPPEMESRRGIVERAARRLALVLLAVTALSGAGAALAGQACAAAPSA
jgi:hypothetical protein